MKTQQFEEIEEFEVETIRSHRVIEDHNKNKKIEFLVKWTNYGDQDNTWQDFYFFS